MAQPRYQVLERIDAGGMAEVFKANATSMQGFQKLVAIKRVLPSLTRNERFVRMFLDEAKVSLHLNHTNCVQVFDLGIADGTYFIVMEFVNGLNLKAILEHLARRHETLPYEQVAYIGLEVCKGLAHAHGKRDLHDRPLEIVHRDISPPNVLLSEEGEVKITDFGLAKAQSQVETTDPGVVKGKFGYLSPEAANGQDVDHLTDVFAVGILLWEMLVGQRLFLGKTDYDTLRQVQAAQIPDIHKYRPDIPSTLVRIVEKALAKPLTQRYQSAPALAQDLAAFLFENRTPVTSFDIATTVKRIRALGQGAQKKSLTDEGINQAVQREIDQLMSLEEVDDLDLYLAKTHTSDSSQERIESNTPIGDLENPASWGMDLELGDEAPSFIMRDEHLDAWQEGGLANLMTRASVDPHKAQQAYDKPAADGLELGRVVGESVTVTRSPIDPAHSPSKTRRPPPATQNPRPAPPSQPTERDLAPYDPNLGFSPNTPAPPPRQAPPLERTNYPKIAFIGLAITLLFLFVALALAYAIK